MASFATISSAAALLLAGGAEAAFLGGAAARPSARPVRATRIAMDGEAEGDFGLAPGQKYGPT